MGMTTEIVAGPGERLIRKVARQRRELARLLLELELERPDWLFEEDAIEKEREVESGGVEYSAAAMSEAYTARGGWTCISIRGCCWGIGDHIPGCRWGCESDL